MKTLSLNTGINIPIVGLGTYKMTAQNNCYEAVRSAIEIGYRHIDTATLYDNEAIIGQAIKDSGVPREAFFITTKLWTDDIRKSNVHGAFRQSLKNLQMDYVDLYLVHWPVRDRYVSVWHDMERIFDTGHAKAIGVSNYWMPQLTALLREAEIMPAVNQIELHPLFNQQLLVEFCQENDIQVEGWRPLGAGRINILENEALLALAEEYGKTPAQIVLRWCIQRNIIVFPQSTSPAHQYENFHVFDFELSDEAMQRITALHTGEKTGANPGDFAF